MSIRVLTGITTTGTPHLGNYAGAIRPAITASKNSDVESFYFLADYHALIKADDPVRVAQSRQELAAAWLACGLDPARVTFYRQSDIAEIPQLTWLLTCVTGKGLLNRAHAYKAAVDKNNEIGEDPDAGVTAGLYMYPVLMAADILAFNAHRVPVGRDQVQHLEMARDIGQRFNHIYGDAWRQLTGKTGEPLMLPEAQVDEHVATLPGLDGRKMSKSYNNTIPLFLPTNEMRKRIMSIVTDSRAPGEPKDANDSHLFQIYRAFASDTQTAAMRQAFAGGISWSEAKRQLFDLIETTVAPMRESYLRLLQRPGELEDILREGARKARAEAAPLLEELKAAVGLSDFRTLPPPPIIIDAGLAPAEITLSSNATVSISKPPSFKQYRESDGRFYFKLIDGEGKVLIQSPGHASPREAGQWIARLKQTGTVLEMDTEGMLCLNGEAVGSMGDATLAAINEALVQLHDD
ncbi:MAG: tryptophan--tRNA ligase [Xanthomonadaceae bacterium]|nr:tryptophan--tRNA ligase [Xanthomonadaceae bacterium]